MVEGIERVEKTMILLRPRGLMERAVTFFKSVLKWMVRAIKVEVITLP